MNCRIFRNEEIQCHHPIPLLTIAMVINKSSNVRGKIFFTTFVAIYHVTSYEW